MSVHELTLQVKFHQSLRRGTKLHYCQFFSLWPLVSAVNSGERKLGEIPRDDHLSAIEHWRRGRRAERTTLSRRHSRHNSYCLEWCGRIEWNLPGTVSACTQYRVLSANFQRPRAWQEIKKEISENQGTDCRAKRIPQLQKKLIAGCKVKRALLEKCSVLRNKKSLGNSLVPRLKTHQLRAYWLSFHSWGLTKKASMLLHKDTFFGSLYCIFNRFINI